MKQDKNTPRALTVYKASAGSGKTFTLSVEYIKLLIKQPYSYRNILAVTFTNKATEEMKMRILSQLYGIWKRLPDSKGYMERVTTDLDASEEFVAERAGQALRNIMHDYGYFRIETIDSFFQSVLRNLARELDLTANLNIELNDQQVEQAAVDEMIEELGDNDDVLQWILSYIKENIDDDKDWNVIGEIKKFGENIFGDSYKSHSERLNDTILAPNFFKQYIGKMHAIMQQSIDDTKHIADEFFECLDNNGLTVDDFSNGKSGACGYFVKMEQGTFSDDILTKRAQNAMDDPDTWVRKTDKDKQRLGIARSLARDRLTPLLIQAERMRPQAWKRYKSAELTLRHMNQLRLLNSIENKIRALNNEANRFLLSDTQSLLHALIKDTDSPFIFEKIGVQLENVMIDEFQDTGTIQWQNFKVLLEECMSRAQNGNLIVGDVKQSIYRWRSGDWRLLNDITSQFANPAETVGVDNLACNYRSRGNIVRFNNAFFMAAASKECDNVLKETGSDSYAAQLSRAYDDVEQEIAKGKSEGGLVRIDLLPKDGYKESTLSMVKDTVQQLIDSGMALRNIAIITRRNESIRLIANYFAMEAPHIKVVSDEAFRLDSSIAVNIIVAALRLLIHPDDNIVAALLVKLYQKHILQQPSLSDNDILLKRKQMSGQLPKEYADHRNELLTQPLFDIVERLFGIFSLDTLTQESAYICTFYDCLCTFMADNAADIDSFLDEWDSSLHTKTIQGGDIDGVRLITIHKSKGLEYDNVIVPFCDWAVSGRGTIWCSPSEQPFAELPIIPIDYYPKQLKGTIYEDDYANEYLQNTVDNLNLLYVAFTRPTANLFVIGKTDNGQQRAKLIKDCLPTVCNVLEGSTLQGNPDNAAEPLSFSYGQLHIPKKDARKASHNIFLRPQDKKEIALCTHGCRADFMQSNKSREFTEGEDDSKQKEYIRQGCILHKLFSTIRTAADIDAAIKQLEFDGIMQDIGMTIAQLRKFLSIRLSTPQVSDWFSGRWQLFNECTILSRDADDNSTAQHRPDRVMTDGQRMVIVDFKFGHPRTEYHDQVRRYMTLVADMGYKQVAGYLWYVYSNKIEEVK